MNKLRLSKAVYALHEIETAKDYYKELCDIRISESELCYELLFDNCKYDLSETMKEFENFVIDLMNTVE